ncbi:MAG: hypothetical protein SGJ00_10420 [bacterium]|nr:hypothetical protein [bacterium]
MKKNLILLACVFIFKIALSQEVDFKWSTPEKLNRKSSAPNLLGIRNEKVLLLKSENPTNTGSYYISTHNIVSLEKDIQIDFGKILPIDVAQNSLFEVYLINDNIVIISITKKDELIGSILDLTGQVVKGKISMDKADSKDKGFDGFGVTISEDQTTILGYRKTKSPDKKSASFIFSTFNSDLKKLNTTKINLPYEDDNISFGRVSIDEKSNVFIVANAKIEGKRKKYDVIKSILLQLQMSQKKPEVNEVNLPLANRLATSMSFLIFDDKIAITGMYADNKDYDYLDGIFYIELSKNSLEVISSSFDKFKSGLQTRFAMTKKMEKGVSYGNVLKDIYIDENKNKLLIFEMVEIYYRTDSKGNVDKTIKTKDLTVVRLTPENKIEWNVNIFKNQYLIIPYYRPILFLPRDYAYRIYKKFENVLSYAILYKNGNIYFIFNDHVKNIGKKNADEVYNNQKKSYSAMVVLNEKTGKWQKKALFKTKESKRLITPRNSAQISDKQILVFTYESKKANLGLLTIE